MAKTERQLPGLLNKLRWLIPVLIAALGVGYTLLEHLLITSHSITSAHVLREIVIIGTIGPILAWLLLTWATRIARSRQQAEEALERRNQELVALNAVGETVGRSLDLSEVLQTALHRLVEVLDLEAAEIRTLEGRKLVLKSHYGVSPQFVADDEIVPLGQCVCGQCAAQSASFIVDDLAAPGAPLAYPCIRERFRSVLAVPMKTREQVLGVIHLASRHPHAFSPHDEQLLGAIGHQIAVALENARLYAETEQRALQLESASQVGRQMTDILDIDQLLTQVVDLIRVSFGYYHVHIFLVDEARNEVELREASGPAATAIMECGLRLGIGREGIVGQVAATGRPLMCNDVGQEPCYYAHELVPETRSELAVPVQVGDRIVGVLDVQSDRCDAFDNTDVKTLQILGDQMAIALENARLFQETHQRFQAMTALHETSLDIISRLDGRQVLEAILQRAAGLLDAQGGSLAIYEAGSNQLRVIATYNMPSKYHGATLSLGEGVAGKVVETGDPLIINDYIHWEEHSETFADSPYDAVIGVPLHWQGQITGCLVVLDRGERRPFVEEDIWLLSAFADLTSIAITNAELYAEVKGLSEELEQRVAERTAQLAAAQAELAEKAEQLQELLIATVYVQEEERTRIARDLHDGSNQLITGTLYEIQAAQQSILGQRGEVALEKLETAKGLLRKIEAENRRIISDLRLPILEARGLVPALKWYAETCRKHYRIACSTHVSGQAVRLSPEVETAVYRIVQESLNNVAAHAQAQSAQVRVEFRPTRLRVVVEDDGVGFDSEGVLTAAAGRMGLIGMRERAQSIGGQIEVRSVPGHGTRIVLDVPLPTKPARE
ncbi:MAG: GAF domain-containing protein, partial [Anaerolineae bacterium]